MSKPYKLTARPRILAHYEKLCTAHDTHPSEAQVVNIRQVVDPVSVYASGRGFYHALLYFVRKSALVFEKDTLFLGWVHQADGSRTKLWFKYDGKQCQVCEKSGALGRCLISKDKPLCDEWHPSIGTVFEPWLEGSRTGRQILYAYLAATIKLIKTSNQSTTFEDYARTVTDDVAITNGTSASYSSRSTTSTTNRRKKLYTQRVVESEQSSEDETAVPRAPSKSAKRVRPNVPAEKTSAVDLTESDHERDIKPESSATTLLASPMEARPKVTAEHKVEELRRKMQSRTVAEINSMLAEKSGLLPSWIEDIKNWRRRCFVIFRLSRICFDSMKYHQKRYEKGVCCEGFALMTRRSKL